MLNVKKTLLVIIVGCLTCMTAVADAPRWVRKGVKSLNNQRSNLTYTFVDFNTHDLDKQWLIDNRTAPLKAYIEDKYLPQYGTVEILPVNDENGLIYNITYKAQSGRNFIVEAKLVDEFMEFTDYELNVYEWEYYQLFAISEPNMRPDYDKFELTQNYNGEAVVKSLIPGMGQIDKGQLTKGYVIMGGEIALAGATLVFDWKRRDAKKMRQQGEFSPSWKSKEQSWQNFEYISAGCFVGLYIFNLIDAATSTGVQQVKVTKADKPSYTFTPYAGSCELGMTFMINF